MIGVVTPVVWFQVISRDDGEDDDLTRVTDECESPNQKKWCHRVGPLTQAEPDDHFLNVYQSTTVPTWLLLLNFSASGRTSWYRRSITVVYGPMDLAGFISLQTRRNPRAARRCLLLPLGTTPSRGPSSVNSAVVVSVWCGSA